MVSSSVNVRKISGPAVEPISLAEARLFLRQDVPGFNGDTMQDGLLQSWIRAARVVCEREIDKAIGPQTFITSLRGFGPLTYDASCYVAGYGYASDFQLPTKPVRSIDEISYRLDGGAYSVLDPTVYRLTDVSGELVLEHGQSWPAAGYTQDSVLIKYTAGMGYPTDSDVGVENIDEDVLSAMRLLIGHFWFNRSAVVQASGAGLQELPIGVKNLLWHNRSSIGV